MEVRPDPGLVGRPSRWGQVALRKGVFCERLLSSKELLQATDPSVVCWALGSALPASPGPRGICKGAATWSPGKGTRTGGMA